MRDAYLGAGKSFALRMAASLSNWIFSAAVVVLSFSVVAEPSLAQSNSFAFTRIDEPNAVRGTVLTGINDKGAIVGMLIDVNGVQHGFSLSGGNFASVEPAGAVRSMLSGINNAGQMSGWYSPPQNFGQLQYGFVFDGMNFTIYPSNVYCASGPQLRFDGLNNVGQIVGDGCPTPGGFVLMGTNLSPVSFPGTVGAATTPGGTNDWGEITGSYCSNCNQTVTHGFTLIQGNYSSIDFPGTNGITQVYGVNNAGQFVGNYGPNGFLWDGMNFITVDFPGAASTQCYGINNHGQIVGSYYDSQGGIHGFEAADPVLLDPVPNAMNGSSVISDATPATQQSTSGADLLLANGRVVQGVAADGVSQVVIAVTATNVGDQVTVTLYNDQSPSTQSGLPNEDGALGKPGDSSFTVSQITVPARNTSHGPTAFAIYRAPMDFARPTSSGFKSDMCKGTPYNDDQSQCRSVSIQFQDVTAGGPRYSMPVIIVRPPVILIHGLWGNITNWDNFNPLITGPRSVDRRFSVGRIGYNNVIGPQIFATNPAYQTVADAKENSLGFQYNAQRAYKSVSDWIKAFKSGAPGNNPLGIAVASVQADIVGHSMGGDIARTLPLQTQYYGGPTFGRGLIHKLITIDTPHLGSPLAGNLLNPANACTRGVMAGIGGNYSFLNVQIQGLGVVGGAVGDLTPLSSALNKINNPTQPQPGYIPTALIAGIYTNFASLNGSVFGTYLQSRFGCQNDPLAQSLTPQGWPIIFGAAPNNQNDAIVSLSSQLNTTNPNPGPTVGFQFPGYLHSHGTKNLGFTLPSVLDPDVVPPSTISVPTQVINLLNTPVTNSTVFVSVNP
jgi:pimeloyl-ACP methyl ester carboxylesterase